MSVSITIMAANKEVVHIQEVQIEKLAVEHACMAHFLHAYPCLSRSQTQNTPPHSDTLVASPLPAKAQL